MVRNCFPGEWGSWVGRERHTEKAFRHLVKKKPWRKREAQMGGSQSGLSQRKRALEEAKT